MQQRIRMLSFLLLLQLASPFVHGGHPNLLQATTSNSKNSLVRRDSSLVHPSASSITEEEGRPSVISKLFFQYVDPIVQKAKTQRLEASDALPVESTRNTKSTSRNASLGKLYQLVKHRHRTDSPSWQLTRALLLDNRRIILTSGLLRFANTLVQAFPAMIISRLLKLMEMGTQEPAKKSVMLVLQLVSVLSIKMVLENQYFHRAIQTSMSVRASLSDLIFAQALTLPSGGSQVVSNSQNATLGTGGVLNLLQSDCGNIESAFLQIHTAWDAPLQIAIYTALLYKYMGSAILYGIGVLIAVIPINMIMLRFLQKFTKAETAAREARTKLTAESIRNMKILKLLAWDPTDRIEEHRRKELRRRSTRGALGALNSAISNAVPAFVLVVTMAAYKGPILASAIFTAISLFNQLRFPLFFLPMFLDAMANGMTAMDRVSSFLSTPKTAEYIVRDADSARISIRNGNFFWPATTVPALKDVNLDITNGEFVAVVGSVGTGKTAFIKSLLGELQPVPANVISSTSHSADHPNVKIGNTAYCSQEAWLPKGTVRDAIIFGRLFDASRYKEVLYTAGLDQDFSAGTLNDATDVGEGGLLLSGGTRARVALARALYSTDAKIFLLDDCLAALDAKVGGLVFLRLQAFAKKTGAAIVLATNDQDVSRRCDRIVMMERDDDSSVVKDIGTFAELVARGHKLQTASITLKKEMIEDTRADKEIPLFQQSMTLHDLSVVGGHSEHVVRGQKGADTTISDCESQYIMEKCPECIPNRPSGPDTPDSETKSEEVAGDDSEQQISPSGAIKTFSSADENMATGAVPLKTYQTYLRSVGNPLIVAMMLAAFLLANGAQFFQQYTVAKWTEAWTAGGTKTGGYLESLSGAAVAFSVLLWIRSFLITRVGVLASRFWHKRMLGSVFSAPMAFFDTTPSGQLLSRFGKEIETVDRSVPESIGSFLYCFLQIGLSAGALIGVITPAMLAPLALVGVLYVGVMAKFRPAARDMKQVEAKTRSPIYTNFGEAIRGSETIRSVPGATQLWKAKHRQYTNTNLSVFGSVKALDRWLSMRLETLGNIVVLATSLSSIVLSRAGRLKAGSVGWGLTQSLAITGLMAWAVRTLTDLESNMLSVVRVQELTDVDSSESDAVIPKESDEDLYPELERAIVSPTSPKCSDALVESGWPWHGHVSFCNVSMRYSPGSQLVLDRVSIDVPRGTTLGIVGRTGSGKSSLLLTLFRLAEIEGDGYIQIDGIDIRSVQLRSLRRSLAIIPQDPTLFTGSVAYNLDATGKASDNEMMTALETASPDLAEYFRSQDGLQTHLDEAGKSLSAGQRQLICLARALVRRSKVLVLDEATSSVDSKTDQEVQATIRREFVEKGVTVITVAHRLDTVLGYDRIAVLGNGKLLEFGSPDRLLERPNGELRSLVIADRKSKQETPPLVNVL